MAAEAGHGRRGQDAPGGERRRDAVNVLVDREDRRVEALPLEGRRVNVNTPDDLRRAERLLHEEG